MLIHKDALAVHEVGSSDDTRYFLNGAMIDKQGRAVATDGRVLVRFTSRACDPDAFKAIDGVDPFTAADDVIVSRADLVAALATIGKKRHGADGCDYLAIVPNGTNVTIATAKDDRTVVIVARKLDGAFPAYERVLDVKKPVVASVILSPKLLETVARMARNVGAQSIRLVLHGESAEIADQILFTAEGDNGTLDGALMPMRP